MTSFFVFLILLTLSWCFLPLSSHFYIGSDTRALLSDLQYTATLQSIIPAISAPLQKIVASLFFSGMGRAEAHAGPGAPFTLHPSGQSIPASVKGSGGEGRNRTNQTWDHQLSTVLKTAGATRHPPLSSLESMSFARPRRSSKGWNTQFYPSSLASLASQE